MRLRLARREGQLREPGLLRGRGGSVYQCSNDRAASHGRPAYLGTYSGQETGPAFDAAFAPGGGPGWGIVVTGKPGRDGEVWKVTN